MVHGVLHITGVGQEAGAGYKCVYVLTHLLTDAETVMSEVCRYIKTKTAMGS